MISGIVGESYVLEQKQLVVFEKVPGLGHNLESLSLRTGIPVRGFSRDEIGLRMLVQKLVRG